MFYYSSPHSHQPPNGPCYSRTKYCVRDHVFLVRWARATTVQEIVYLSPPSPSFCLYPPTGRVDSRGAGDGSFPGDAGGCFFSARGCSDERAPAGTALQGGCGSWRVPVCWVTCQSCRPKGDRRLSPWDSVPRGTAPEQGRGQHHWCRRVRHRRCLGNPLLEGLDGGCNKSMMLMYVRVSEGNLAREILPTPASWWR